MRNADRTPLYNCWVNMRDRCNNANRPDYCRYGGRGISYPPRWDRFENFVEDVGAGWSPGLTLDRRENDEHYSIDNCRWVTQQVQNTNTRTSKLTLQQAVEIRYLRSQGKRPMELARMYKVSPSIISNVLHSWSHCATETDLRLEKS